mgnify:CR=1 FL=1
MIVKLPDKSAKSVMAAFETLLDEYGEHFGGIFKIITTDNGSEFADLSNFEKLQRPSILCASLRLVR